MNAFQYLSLLVLGSLFLWDAFHWWRDRGPQRNRLFRCGLFAATGSAIAHPGTVQATANAVGIGRGTDVVLYLVVFALMALSLFFYSRYTQLQAQMTQLVRHLAIQEAQRLERGADEGKS